VLWFIGALQTCGDAAPHLVSFHSMKWISRGMHSRAAPRDGMERIRGARVQLTAYTSKDALQVTGKPR